MAKRGYVAAEIEYENTGNPPDICFEGTFDPLYVNFTTLPPYASFSPRAKANSTLVALDVLCSMTAANCSKVIITSSDRFPPRIYPPVPPPIGSRPGYILPSLLRLVPAP
eukprot:7949717-Pyramimonas_sp.AAC.1